MKSNVYIFSLWRTVHTPCQHSWCRPLSVWQNKWTWVKTERPCQKEMEILWSRWNAWGAEPETSVWFKLRLQLHKDKNYRWWRIKKIKIKHLLSCWVAWTQPYTQGHFVINQIWTWHRKAWCKHGRTDGDDGDDGDDRDDRARAIDVARWRGQEIGLYLASLRW